MAVAPNGALYVTEAGRGGDGPCAPNPANELRCFGKTGAISKLWRGKQSRVVEGLDSTALPGGALAGGANDISFQGTGGAFITMGLGGGPAFRETLGGELLGKLLHMTPGDKWHDFDAHKRHGHGDGPAHELRVVSDVAAHEFATNPAGGALDSNPFGVLAEAFGRLVADAGANALFRVFANGAVKTVAVFPSQVNPTGFGPPMVESVPTAVARSPDGALYVGELSGFPFAEGLARIFRVKPGKDPVVHCTGFKTITDIAFARDGSLYVVENATGGFFFPPNSGQLSRVAPDCTRTTVLVGLDWPTSVAVGRDGSVYVTNHGVTPGIGEVLRIEP